MVPGAPTKPKSNAPKPMRAPGFNKPKPAAMPQAASQPKETAAKPKVPQTAPTQPSSEITIGGGIDGFDVDDGLLDDEDDVRVAVQAAPQATPPKPVTKPPTNKPKAKAAAMPRSQHQTAAGSGASTTATATATATAAAKTATRPTAPKLPKPEPVAARTVPDQAPVGRLIEVETTRPLIARPASMPAAASSTPEPVVLMPRLPELPQQAASRKADPSATALAFVQWLQQGLASREIKYNESGAPVHFTAEGMALVSPLIFKQYARQTGSESQADMLGLQVQREVLKAGWHLMVAAKGAGKVNIVSYEVIGRGSQPVGKLSAVVLTDPDRFVLPVPPANPVLKLA